MRKPSHNLALLEPALEGITDHQTPGGEVWPSPHAPAVWELASLPRSRSAVRAALLMRGEALSYRGRPSLNRCFASPR